MSSRKLYPNVVRSGSSDEDLGLVHGEQDRKIDGHVPTRVRRGCFRGVSEIEPGKILQLLKQNYHIPLL